MSRVYCQTIPDYADVMTIQEWSEFVRDGVFIEYDGTGYWCRDGRESHDEVFSTPAQDATHVAWYNK